MTDQTFLQLLFTGILVYSISVLWFSVKRGGGASAIAAYWGGCMLITFYSAIFGSALARLALTTIENAAATGVIIGGLALGAAAIFAMFLVVAFVIAALVAMVRGILDS